MKTIYPLILICFFQIAHADAQTLKGFLFNDKSVTGGSNDDSAKVIVYADGNVKALLTSDENSSNATNGSIGLRVEKPDKVWNLSMNIVSNIDTLKSGFGSVVLNPSNGKKILSGLVDLQTKSTIFGTKGGIHAYATSSSSKWTVNDSTKSATVAGLGCLLRKDIIEGELLKKPISTSFEFGLAFRGIFGNISHDKEFLNRAIGTKVNIYPGLEGGMNIYFNNISFGLHGYWLFDVNEKREIDDITSFQITGGISIEAPLFSGKVKM